MNRHLEILGVFARIGATAFGGPAAHVAMMEDEFVRRRKWLTRERFLDLFGGANLLPGPTSTETALLLGRERGGLLGLVLAGIGFISPAFICVVAIAMFLQYGGKTPAFDSALRGMQPVIVAIVAHALFMLCRTAFKSVFLVCCALLAGAAAIFRPDLILVILSGAGVLSIIANFIRSPRKVAGLFGLIATLRTSATSAAEAAGAAADAAPLVTIALWPMFWGLLKIGAVFYGSGYVMYSFLREEFVVKHLITEAQLVTAITVGQVTPGPFFTSGAFVGYQLHGFKGAVLATIGMFGPAFVYAALSAPLIARLRGSSWAGAFLDGVNAASCALMAVISWQLGRHALIDWKTVALFVICLAILFRFKFNSAWLVLAGALIGWIAL